MSDIGKIPVIITGAGGPAGINFIKSLETSKTFHPIGVDMNKYRIHLCPTEPRYVVPSCTHIDYFDTIYKIAEKNHCLFIHPQPDVEVRCIAGSRNCLLERGIHTFLPSTNTIEILQDKFSTAIRLFKEKLSPKTNLIVSGYEYYMIDDAIKDIGFPMWVRATEGAGGHASSFIGNSHQLYAWIDYWISRGLEQMVAQEYLPGRNYAWHSLWKEGILVTSMARERIEYIYPGLAPSGITGTPAVQVTIHNDRVNRIGKRAIQLIDPKYTGIACVDMKEDRNGFPTVCEVNPGRMFTTSLFFTQLGNLVKHKMYGNFPELYLRLAHEMDMPGGLPVFDSLPEDWYWIRHIDAGHVMIHKDDLDEKICNCL